MGEKAPRTNDIDKQGGFADEKSGGKDGWERDATTDQAVLPKIIVVEWIGKEIITSYNSNNVSTFL